MSRSHCASLTTFFETCKTLELSVGAEYALWLNQSRKMGHSNLCDPTIVCHILVEFFQTLIEKHKMTSELSFKKGYNNNNSLYKN